ncbi:MFS transporter [Singulisphaera acidiphila]|uniref:Arabinose efflux permease family protein n=1 Tax=Singulisphaera acidiphila (strain ATCC BAA-1392 / DSM 18658 / VKM B-2454 / MOB10) TaxID=886293 RepID=L0DMF3_SINAD|nr:MFS transporter [Singulisphaera acidiphila]AGA30564.1 arabinose efflux permease family protein [Singulisphaera acidiphila DSM 18658]
MKSLPRILILLALVHGLVDAFGAFVQPLWPDLQRSLALEEGSIQWAYVLWGLATSVSQLAFGYWGDRRPRGWLLWAGPAVGLFCLSVVGLAPGLASLSSLLIVGGLGIAAFHPEAAALAGSCVPHDRSRAMSVFAVGGYLGQAAGPIYSGVITTHFGLKALVWSLIWGLPLLGLLILGLRDHSRVAKQEQPRPAVPLADLVRGRGPALCMVLAIGILRVLPALGTPLALSYLLKGRGHSNEFIGIVQSAFLAGIGGGSLGCALFVRRGIERRILWQLPLIVAPLVWIYPLVNVQTLIPSVSIGGFLLGATMPILVSYGQRLMPEGQRIASSITMGVTWGIGGVLVALTTSLANRLHMPELAFMTYAIACASSGLLCFWLPDGDGERDAHEFQPSRPSYGNQ